MSDEPEYVNNRPRSERVDLDHHIRYLGKVHDHFVVVRLSTRQVSDWLERVEAKEPDLVLGNVLDCDGEVVPAKVLDKLDDDDDKRVEEVISRFLPKRLLPLLASDPETSTVS